MLQIFHENKEQAKRSNSNYDAETFAKIPPIAGKLQFEIITSCFLIVIAGLVWCSYCQVFASNTMYFMLNDQYKILYNESNYHECQWRRNEKVELSTCIRLFSIQ